MSKVIWVEDRKEFDEIITKSEKVVVDFTAPAWCNPCQQFAPHYDNAAEKSEATFVAVDVDKAEWAMADFGVRSVPTVVLFDGDEEPRVLKERTVVKLLAEIA